jgi:hypothetical protein
LDALGGDDEASAEAAEPVEEGGGVRDAEGEECVDDQPVFRS